MSSEVEIPNLDSLREAAITLLREVESLANRQPQNDQKLDSRKRFSDMSQNSFATHSSGLAAISAVRRNFWA